MRLIDAEEFKRQIVGMTIVNDYPPRKAIALCELIDKQPTAYDVCEWTLDSHLENYTPAEWLICPHSPKKYFQRILSIVLTVERK